MSTSDLAAIWRYLADTSCRGYSPLYDRICRHVADSEETLALVTEAPPPGHHPLLLLAAVHYLLLDGLDHPLAAVYAGESNTDPGPLFVEVCLQNRAALLALLETEQVNTNEVGRAAIIAPALATVAARLGGPLGHIDVGCSAGLNLLVDRYRIDYGPHGGTGPDDALVHLRCDIVGGEPPISAVPITVRIGLDRAPQNVHDPHQARWQLACVWPDTGRIERTRRAHEEARRGGITLVKGDALDVVDLLARLPPDVTAVVTTTWVLSYFSKRERIAFREALATASATRPVAWISADGQGVVDVIPSEEAPRGRDGVEWCPLGLVTFRQGVADAELLAYAGPHGSGLDWRA